MEASGSEAKAGKASGGGKSKVVKETMSDRIKCESGAVPEVDLCSAGMRAAIEGDVEKARRFRSELLKQRYERPEDPSMARPGFKDLDMAVINGTEFSKLKISTMFSFDKSAFDLRNTLFDILDLNSADKMQDLNKSYIDSINKGKGKNDIRAEKLQIFKSLLSPIDNLDRFQSAFDKFVRTVIMKDVEATYPDCGDLVYYQSFPCIRMVRPGEFSIGNVIIVIYIYC
jgi:hypothetical protein